IMELAGDTSVASGELKPARQFYLKNLILAPRDASRMLKLSAVYQRLGYTDNALKYARAAVETDKASSAAHLVLGRLLEYNRDYRAAELQYERAMEVATSPDERILVHGPWLRIFFEMNKYPDADKWSKKWASENPQSADCH